MWPPRPGSDTTADSDEKAWASLLAPENGFLPGTTDLLHGRLAKAKRFVVAQYHRQRKSIPQPVEPEECVIPKWKGGQQPFHTAVISSTLNPCTPSKNCPRCGRAVRISRRHPRIRTVLLLLSLHQPPRSPEESHELSDKVVIGRTAYYLCVGLRRCLRRDALHAGCIRIHGRGAHRGAGGAIPQGVRPARSGNRATSKKYRRGQRDRAHGN